MCLFNGSNFTIYNTSNSGLINDTVTALYDTPAGLWIGTQQGLSFYNGTVFTNYNTSNSGLVNNVINCIEKDSANNFYFGTNGGYSYYDASNWYNTTVANSSLISDTIKNIQYISSKACWMQTAKGLSKLSYGNIISFTDSTCIHPEYTSPFHNNTFGICKKGNDLIGYGNYGFSIDPIKKITDDNIVLIFNDSLPLVSSIHFTPGVYSITDANNIVWTACDFSGILSSHVLLSFNEQLSTGTHPPITYTGNADDRKILAGNLVTTSILNKGDFYWDLDNAKYEVPRCSGKHAIYAGALWMGGYDQNGLLHTSAMTYRQSNGTDFWQGPLDTLTGITDTNTVKAYNHIWKFEKDTINSFITNFLNGNVSNGSYPIPSDILTYPAIGTGNFTRNMAPYIDYNNDGNYNPYDGDYPAIKGNQHLYWIFNDNDTMHTETNGIPLGFEIHGSAYAYYCPQFTINDSAGVINYTTFYNFELYNRSSNTYDSLFIGVWLDTDLGSYDDDFIGCDTVLNIGFSYNGDNDDGTGVISGYGINPPMINCQILKGPAPNASDGIDNDHDGAIDETGETNMMSSFRVYDGGNATPVNNPSIDIDYYYYLSSRWLDGSHLTYGGWGYNTGIPTDYAYSGTPYDTGWTEINEGNTPSDRRIIVASGPFSLAPGQMKSLDYAIVFTWDSTAANGLNTSIAKNIIGNQKIKQWFDAGVLDDCGLLFMNDTPVLRNGFYVYPNPANNTINLIANFAGTEPLLYTIRDLTGRIIDQNYFAQSTSVSVKNFDPAVYLISVSNNKIFCNTKVCETIIPFIIHCFYYFYFT
ncbi:MAG: T9SS type A sorting domain-containing protein [Bacteroidetes bacterium]|nr:T9SS type A sorting domain-containing protein [Bacteroidota bacterium]